MMAVLSGMLGRYDPGCRLFREYTHSRFAAGFSVAFGSR